MAGMPGMADMAAGMAGMNMDDIASKMPDLSEFTKPKVEDLD
jgi:hypothetical protein